jgi:hypothetical protein
MGVNTHYDLSWFKSLLGGNSPTSSDLILKMNSGYNGVSREFKSLCGEGGNDLVPPA